MVLTTLLKFLKSRPAPWTVNVKLTQQPKWLEEALLSKIEARIIKPFINKRLKATRKTISMSSTKLIGRTSRMSLTDFLDTLRRKDLMIQFSTALKAGKLDTILDRIERLPFPKRIKPDARFPVPTQPSLGAGDFGIMRISEYAIGRGTQKSVLSHMENSILKLKNEAMGSRLLTEQEVAETIIRQQTPAMVRRFTDPLYQPLKTIFKRKKPLQLRGTAAYPNPTRMDTLFLFATAVLIPTALWVGFQFSPGGESRTYAPKTVERQLRTTRFEEHQAVLRAIRDVEEFVPFAVEQAIRGVAQTAWNQIGGLVGGPISYGDAEFWMDGGSLYAGKIIPGSDGIMNVTEIDPTDYLPRWSKGSTGQWGMERSGTWQNVTTETGSRTPLI